MATVTVSTAENALKSVYLGAITELLNTKVNALYGKIAQTGDDVWGKEIRKAVKIGLNGGVGAGGETDALPTAHGNTYVQFAATLKNLYGQIEISDKAIRAGADDRGAFTNLLNAELEALLEASKFNLGRMLYGDGSGALAGVLAAGGTTLTLDGVKNVVEGMVCDVMSGGVAVKKNVRILSVDRANNTVEVSATVTFIDGSRLYVQNSKDKEITGIGAIFDVTKPLYGVARSNRFMNPYAKNAVGLMSETTVQEAVDVLENESNSTVDFLACAADVKYAYQEFLSQYKRNIDIMELEGGYKTLSYNGIPLVYDRFVEDGTMYLLNTKAFKLHQLCDWRFLETENGNILRQTQGAPTYSATLVKYCDLMCDKPNGQGKLTGITRE